MLSCKGSHLIPPGRPFPGHYSTKAKWEAAAQPQPGLRFLQWGKRSAPGRLFLYLLTLKWSLVFLQWPEKTTLGTTNIPQMPHPCLMHQGSALSCHHMKLSAVHGKWVLDCWGNTLSSACKSFPPTLLYPKPCFYLASRMKTPPSHFSPLQKPKFSQRAIRYSYATKETPWRSMFEQHDSRWILSNYADKRDKKHIPADTWLRLHSANWLQLMRWRHWS